MTVLKNPKHEAVLQAYFADPARIGSRAWRKVFPRSSKHAAETSITRLLKRAECAARLAELEAKVAEQLVVAKVMSATEVLEGLSRLARANMADFMEVGPDGQPRLNWAKLTRDQSAALAQVEVEQISGGDDELPAVVKVKFRLHDKRGALRDLGQHHKLFVERVEVDDKRSIADRLDAARRRDRATGRDQRDGAKARSR